MLLTFGGMFRRCLLQPMPEHDYAATWLAEAADALLENRLDEAAELVRRSDLCCLEDYRHRVAGRLDPAIHRIATMPLYQRIGHPISRRMPTARAATEVLPETGIAA